MGMLVPSCSWTINPRMPIIAARPWLSSTARLLRLVSSLHESQIPWNVPLRKSPGNSIPMQRSDDIMSENYISYAQKRIETQSNHISYIPADSVQSDMKVTSITPMASTI